MKKETRYYINPLQAHKRRFPLFTLMIIWLMLDRFHAPNFIMAIFYVLAAIVLLIYIIYVRTTEIIEVDIELILKNYHEAKQQDEKIKKGHSEAKQEENPTWETRQQRYGRFSNKGN